MPRTAPPPSPSKQPQPREIRSNVNSLSNYHVWAPVRGSARDDYSIELVPHAHEDPPPAAFVFWCAARARVRPTGCSDPLRSDGDDAAIMSRAMDLAGGGGGGGGGGGAAAAAGGTSLAQQAIFQA